MTKTTTDSKKSSGTEQSVGTNKFMNGIMKLRQVAQTHGNFAVAITKASPVIGNNLGVLFHATLKASVDSLGPKASDDDILKEYSEWSAFMISEFKGLMEEAFQSSNVVIPEGINVVEFMNEMAKGEHAVSEDNEEMNVDPNVFASIVGNASAIALKGVDDVRFATWFSSLLRDMKKEALTAKILMGAVSDSIVKLVGTINSALVGKVRDTYEVNSVKAGGFVARALNAKDMSKGIRKVVRKYFEDFLSHTVNFE